MVSGFFTSPWDHWRMSSAVARPMRNSSKKLTSSKMPPAFSGWCCESGIRACSSSRDPVGAPVSPRARLPSHLVDAHRTFVGAPGQVDAELLGRAEHVLVRLPHLDGQAVAGEHLDVEAQRLHLLDQHLEGFRDAGLGDVLALDDGL